jgi:hypothetical protein
MQTEAAGPGARRRRRGRRRRRWPVVALGGGLALLACLWLSQAALRAGEPAEGQEIRLDYRPLEEPTATFLRLREDGTAELVRCRPYQALVVARCRGAISPSERDTLFAQLRRPEILDALQDRDFHGDAPREGDQFTLTLLKQGKRTGRAFGTVENAPAALQELIRRLRALGERLPSAALSPAYVRSQPVAQARYDALRKAGKTPFLERQAAPQALRPPLEDAIRHPGEFLPLTRAHYRQLLSFCTSGADLFVTEGNAAFQLSLFSSKSLPGNQEKERTQ